LQKGRWGIEEEKREKGVREKEDAERKSVAQASLLASSSTLKLQRREYTTEAQRLLEVSKFIL